jgi:hypothetical protein
VLALLIQEESGVVMPLSWILNIGALALLVMGAQEIWTSITNFSPQRVSCEQYFSSKSSTTWLELYDCRIDYQSAVKTWAKGTVIGEHDVAYYAPVRSPAHPEAAVSLLIKVPDDVTPVLAPFYLEDSSANRKEGSPGTLDEKLRTNAEHLIQLSSTSITVKGERVRGVYSDSKLRKVLERDPPADWRLVDDWQIIDPTAQPHFGGGIAAFLGGLLFLLWRIASSLGRSKSTEPVSPAPAPRIGPTH